MDENQLQVMLIVAQENQPAYLPLYQLAITTGMRQGELLGLTLDDLDWNKGTLKINRQLQRITGEGLCLKPPKTNAGRRTIKIGETTLSMLKEHQKIQFKTMACRDPVWQDKNFIFSEDNGAPIAPRKVLKAFKRILVTAGLPDIRFHEDIFPDYNIDGFETAFKEYYQIMEKDSIHGTERTLYLMKRID
ncbi:MAG: tyrosine-type recombinase/integrase [Anaerolineaceae bacterium]|nr:tyrosine-type recombinase/integrase [Anaerolineaceae bacterium]